MKKVVLALILIIIIGGIIFFLVQNNSKKNDLHIVEQNQTGLDENALQGNKVNSENQVNNENNLTGNIENVTDITNSMEPAVVTNKATIYIGTTSSFESFEVDVDDTLSVEDRAKFLIKQVGDAIGYDIIVNEIFSGKGGMTVDLKAESAPFNVRDTYIGNNNEKYHIYDLNQLVYTVFDSIKETLQKYFGETMDVWFAKEEEQIIIKDGENVILEIPLYEPYKGSEK